MQIDGKHTHTHTQLIEYAHLLTTNNANNAKDDGKNQAAHVGGFQTRQDASEQNNESTPPAKKNT